MLSKCLVLTANIGCRDREITGGRAILYHAGAINSTRRMLMLHCWVSGALTIWLLEDTISITLMVQLRVALFNEMVLAKAMKNSSVQVTQPT